MKNTRITFYTLLFIYITVAILWTLYRATFSLPETLDEFVIKPILWLCPIFIYIKNKTKLKQIFSVKKISFRILGITLIVAVVMPFIMQILPVMLNGKTFLPPSYSMILLSLFISAATACVEEILFRGLLLQYIQKMTSPTLANISTSILFALIHVPIIMAQNKEIGGIFFALFIIFACSIVYGLVYIKTKSLLPSVIIHALNNFFLSLI